MTLDAASRPSVKHLMSRIATFAVPVLPVPLAAYLGSRIAQTRALGRYPGWRFAVEESNPTPLLRMRRRLWEHFKKKGIEHPVRVHWFDGLQVDLVLGNDQSRCLYVGGSFEPNEFAFLERVLHPGMTVVDAGANEGFYTLFMAKRVGADGMVIAVEPSPREHSRLVHNIAINDLRNVHVLSVGLGAEPGYAVLHIADSEHNGQNTLGAFVYNGVTEESDLRIELQPLDAIAERTERARIDLIKMDVEGAELKVLQGASRVLEQYQPLVLFEVLEKALRAQGTTPDELVAFLTRRGFAILRFEADGTLSPLSSLADASSNLVAVPSARVPEILKAARS